jgi:hypothetical protein
MRFIPSYHHVHPLFGKRKTKKKTMSKCAGGQGEHGRK